MSASTKAITISIKAMRFLSKTITTFPQAQNKQFAND